MEFFTDEVMRGLLSESLETAELGAEGSTDIGTGPGSPKGNYIYRVSIGRLAEIPAATKAGYAS